MSRARLFLFHDFYEAHFAAHQLQKKGIHAEVLENSFSPTWPDCGFRILAIQTDDQDDGQIQSLAPVEPGMFGKKIDHLFRILWVVMIFACPVLFCFIALGRSNADPNKSIINLIDLLSPLVCGILLLVMGWLISLLLDGFRNGNGFCCVIIYTMGWIALFSFGLYHVGLLCFPAILVLLFALMFFDKPSGIATKD